jgi:hypothetical protein
MRLAHVSCLALAVATTSVLFAACRKSPTGPVVPTLPEVPEQMVLLHDEFHEENGGVGTNNWTEFEHWDVIDGCVDLHGNGFYDVLEGNGLYVDLDGTCNHAGTIRSKTDYQLEPGVTYVLEFWLGGNQRINTPDTVNVSLGTLYNEQFVLPRTQPFRSYTRQISVQANTEAKLQFQNLGGDNQGALLAQVRLRRAQ